MLKTCGIFLYSEKHPRNCFNDDVKILDGCGFVLELTVSVLAWSPMVEIAVVFISFAA